MSQLLLDLFHRSYFLIVYGIALMISVKTYRKYFETVFKYLPLIIAYTFLNELLGYFIKYYPDFSLFNDIKYSNINEIIYNLYDIVFFPYFYYAYWKLSTNSDNKKRIAWASSFAILAYLISCIFQNPMDTMLYYAYFVASFVLVYCIATNFIEKKQNNIDVVNTYNLVFWINMALIIFYAISPFLLFIGYTKIEIWNQFHFALILKILIIIMYSILTIGLLLNRKLAFR